MKSINESEVIPSFGAMLRRALGDAINADAGENFLDMCSEDILFQMPYAPDGAVRELRGRDALRTCVPKAGRLIDFQSMRLTAAHKSSDGETFTLEFTCKAAVTETGARYDQVFVSVVRVQDGLIVLYRDYWNPLILLNAIGGPERLKTVFEEAFDA